MPKVKKKESEPPKSDKNGTKTNHLRKFTQMKIGTNTCLFMDKRRKLDNGRYPVKIKIGYGKNLYLSTGIDVAEEDWDSLAQCSTNPKDSGRNRELITALGNVIRKITELRASGVFEELSGKNLKNAILEIEEESPKESKIPATFVGFYKRVMGQRSGRTAAMYAETLKKLRGYFGERLDRMTFDSFTLMDIEDWDAHMAKTAAKATSRDIHHRNLKCVFNRAIDHELTTNYPYRRFKLKKEATRKRALAVEQVRKIFKAELPKDLARWRDLWCLEFMLLGINVVDLCGDMEIDNNGRLLYKRSKTHKEYSIALLPEAKVIIDRYAGKDGAILNVMETHTNYRYFYNVMYRGLGRLKDYLNGINDGVKIDLLTSYVSRHTWATLASRLDFPLDTIRRALGHGGNTVTDIYIDFDMSKVDACNRAVLDYILQPE